MYLRTPWGHSFPLPLTRPLPPQAPHPRTPRQARTPFLRLLPSPSPGQRRGGTRKHTRPSCTIAPLAWPPCRPLHTWSHHSLQPVGIMEARKQNRGAQRHLPSKQNSNPDLSDSRALHTPTRRRESHLGHLVSPRPRSGSQQKPLRHYEWEHEFFWLPATSGSNKDGCVNKRRAHGTSD